MFSRQTKKTDTDPSKISEILSRGVNEVIGAKHLRNRLDSGKQLRIKLGIDPTGEHIHLGHAVSLLKLRDFQNLGHQVILIIGDATGVIGDTSDKNSERPMMTREQLKKNKKTYLQQAERVLDKSLIKLEHNSSWLDKLGFSEIGEQAEQFSVSDFISRDNIRRRLDEGKRVSLRETLYPLMQGYDSVAVKADVELGGTDQRFNLLAGRALQKHYGQEEQDIIMSDLIEGTDGNKMSKSSGNTINIFDTEEDMYGKVMRIPDKLIKTYFVSCTRVPLEEIDANMDLHPNESKKKLAYEIVSLYHGTKKADEAQAFFKKTFSEGGKPDKIGEVAYSEDIKRSAVEAKIVRSGSEYRRLAEAGAIKNIDTGEVLLDPNAVLKKSTNIKIGKKRFVKFVVK